MQNFFDNTKLVTLIWNNRKKLLLIVSIALGLAIFFSSSFFFPTLYKSEIIVYPVNLPEYSEESASEQMQQVLESNYIRKRLIHDFNLYEYYKIDSADKFSFVTINEKIDKRLKISKTQFSSIHIKVYDNDPELSPRMADSIISYYNQKVRYLHRIKSGENLKIKKQSLKNIKKKIDSLENIRQQLREKYGILHYEWQSREATEGYFNLLIENRYTSIPAQKTDSLLNSLKEKGGRFEAAGQMLENLYETYNTVLEDYFLAKEEYTKKISYAQVVSHPEILGEKVVSFRIIIISVITLTSLIFAIIILILLEFTRANSSTKEDNQTDVK